jgi:hypothetical protein
MQLYDGFSCNYHTCIWNFVRKLPYTLLSSLNPTLLSLTYFAFLKSLSFVVYWVFLYHLFSVELCIHKVSFLKFVMPEKSRIKTIACSVQCDGHYVWMRWHLMSGICGCRWWV